MSTTTTITDADVGLPYDPAQITKTTHAGRGLLVNDTGQIGLLYFSKRNHYGLFGGSIKKDETPLQATIREIQEESGYESTLISSLTTIDIHMMQRNENRITHVFLMKTGTLGKQSLVGYEQKVDIETRRFDTIDQAIRIINQEPHDDNYYEKFAQKTTLTVLDVARNYLLEYNQTQNVSTTRSISSTHTQKLIQQVYFHHKKYFPDKNKQQKKLAIIYSATPGMGKSTLTQKLYKKFSANVIENDMVRDILKKLGHDTHSLETNNFIKVYVQRLFNTITTKWKNKFVIFDSSCDRKYDNVKVRCDTKNIPLYVIRFEVSLETALHRIHTRYNKGEGREPKQQLINNTKNNLRLTYLAFGKRNIANIHYNGVDDDESIYAFITKILS